MDLEEGNQAAVWHMPCRVRIQTPLTLPPVYSKMSTSQASVLNLEGVQSESYAGSVSQFLLLILYCNFARKSIPDSPGDLVAGLTALRQLQPHRISHPRWTFDKLLTDGLPLAQSASRFGTRGFALIPKWEYNSVTGQYDRLSSTQDYAAAARLRCTRLNRRAVRCGKR